MAKDKQCKQSHSSKSIFGGNFEKLHVFTFIFFLKILDCLSRLKGLNRGRSKPKGKAFSRLNGNSFLFLMLSLDKYFYPFCSFAPQGSIIYQWCVSLTNKLHIPRISFNVKFKIFKNTFNFFFICIENT